MTDHHHADNDGVSASGHRNEEAAIFLYDGEEDVPQDVTRVKLDASLRMIYAQIFFVHSHLSYVDLPEGLKSIRGRAFFMCEALSYIRFPSTLEEIESKKNQKQWIAPTGKVCNSVPSALAYATKHGLLLEDQQQQQQQIPPTTTLKRKRKETHTISPRP